MPQIERLALVPYSALQMYHLVNDIPSYPQFLNWCSHAQILESDQRSMLASIAVEVAGIEQSFTTRNTLQPGQAIHLEAIDGPFHHLDGHWAFRELGDDGCKVLLTLDFSFSSGLLSSAFSGGFSLVAGMLVADFCKRADQLYA